MPNASAAARTARPFLWIAPLLIALGAARAEAQVRGTVVDGSARPVAGAMVELWDLPRPAAAKRTDDQGRFELPGPADGELLLTVRAPGLATQTIPLASRDTAVTVTMEAQAATLRTVTVAATAGRLCPRREEPRARALWERMRSRYRQPDADTNTVLVFGFLELRSGTGEKNDAYDPGAGRTTAGWTTGPPVLAVPELMARSGYALRAAGGAGDRTAFWSYRALDEGMMQDFTGDYFGAAHTLSILSQGPERTTIAFCPRGRLRRTGQIEGTLTLRADTTLESARWSFRTPAPDEDAGGEASYLPPDPALGRALLTSESVFWRRSGARAYFFEAKAFTGWRRRAR